MFGPTTSAIFLGFLPIGGKWGLNSACYLFDLDELDANEEIPIFAVQNNYRYALEHPVKTYSFWLCTFLFTSIVLH
jgi:hypothetical protein